MKAFIINSVTNTVVAVVYGDILGYWNNQDNKGYYLTDSISKERAKASSLVLTIFN